MRILNFAFLFMIVVSCNKHKDRDKNQLQAIKTTELINQAELPKFNKYKNNCVFDSLKMQTTEYQEINFFTENSMRGKGVLTLGINSVVVIYNLDKSEFGSIKFKDETYELNFPKVIIAREIMPQSEFQVFSFDAELPSSNPDNLVIYINKEKKLISKKGLQYNFLDWTNYIKSAFIEINPDFKGLNKEEQKYWYKVIEIKNDSMKIKSVSKTDCDYIEDYKNVNKWIKWKNDSCKLIKLNFCY